MLNLCLTVYILLLFKLVNLVILLSQMQWRGYIVNAIHPTCLFQYFGTLQMFYSCSTDVLFMVWRCVCGLDIIVKFFLLPFSTRKLSHFSPSHTQWVLCERSSSHSFIPIFLTLRRRVGPQTLWRFWIKYFIIDERVRAWCHDCCQVPLGLTVGFLLLQYSVVYTVESLSLFCLLFISRFVCTWRVYIDKLGIFHANQISVFLDPHQK